jgi:hypothetical protein
VSAVVERAISDVRDGTRYGAAEVETRELTVKKPNEAVPARTPQRRWIGFVIIMAAVVSLIVLPTVRGRIQRLIGV